VLNRLIDKDNVKMTVIIKDKEIEFEGKVGKNSHLEKTYPPGKNLMRTLDKVVNKDLEEDVIGISTFLI